MNLFSQQHPGTKEVLRRAAAEPSHELLRSPLSTAARLGLDPGPAAGEAYMVVQLNFTSEIEVF